MAIIKAEKTVSKKQIRARLPEGLLQEIERYSSWVGGVSLDEFLCQAAEYVLGRDKEWQTAKRTTTRGQPG